MSNIKQEAMTQAVQAAPAASIIGATLVSITINEWLAGISICFILLQAAYLVWKWVKEYKKDLNG